MASFVRNPLASLLRSAGSAQAARCQCSVGGARRFLATVVDAKEQLPPQAQSETAGIASASAPSSSTASASEASADTASSSPSTSRPSPFANNPGRRAPLPVPASRAEEAQQIYLPNIIFRLVRNSPKEAKNPFIATFRVPVQLTKPDIVSYLWQIYGLKVTSISTITEMGEMVRMRPGKYKSERRLKNTKKAIVGMEEPFWFPEKRPVKWLQDNFETCVVAQTFISNPSWSFNVLMSLCVLWPTAKDALINSQDDSCQ